MVGYEQLTQDWPDQSSFDTLVKMTVPLFIVAATICRFISDRKIGTPRKLLERVLSRSDDSRPQLGTTYRSVLDNLTAGKSVSQRAQIIQQFHEVIGPIVLLATPLSTSSLAELLGISKDDIDSRLDLLHSVLRIPASAKAPTGRATTGRATTGRESHAFLQLLCSCEQSRACPSPPYSQTRAEKTLFPMEMKATAECGAMLTNSLRGLYVILHRPSIRQACPSQQPTGGRMDRPVSWKGAANKFAFPAKRSAGSSEVRDSIADKRTWEKGESRGVLIHTAAAIWSLRLLPRRLFQTKRSLVTPMKRPMQERATFISL